VSTRAAARRLPVIAIDGPGGSGKSTVSRELARRLRWRYLDTGAMYRAVTLAVLEAGVDADDTAAIVAVAAAADVMVETDPDDPGTYLAGRPVNDLIRTRSVTNAVSAVSAVPEIRAIVLVQQRTAIGAGEIVVEGRDIGTTVVPDAEIKIFLTADAGARAARRHRDTDAPDANDLAVVHEEIARRDALDAGRSTSPLARAADAIEIDTTSMTVDDVVRAILEQCPPGIVAAASRSDVEA
jgi:cytidylate kinase